MKATFVRSPKACLWCLASNLFRHKVQSLPWLAKQNRLCRHELWLLQQIYAPWRKKPGRDIKTIAHKSTWRQTLFGEELLVVLSMSWYSKKPIGRRPTIQVFILEPHCSRKSRSAAWTSLKRTEFSCRDERNWVPHVVARLPPHILEGISIRIFLPVCI